MTIPGCPAFLAPLCTTVTGAGSGILGAGAGAILSAMAGWVVTGAGWLLNQIGGAMAATTRVNVTAGWFVTHYQAMAAIAMVVALPMLLVAAIQAVYRQSPSVLARSALVHLPLAALLTGVAVQLVQLSLAATDALSSSVAAGAGAGLDRALARLATTLVALAAGGPSGVPLFVVVLGALLVALGALALWLELLVRAAAVYVAVVFLPLALASLVWPAVGHWCRRLVDTLAALILSKFVIVAVLSLAVGAIGAGTGSGFSAVLEGGALLLLAAFTPFVLLRLVPAVEAGAVHQLEGARHRVRRAAGSLPETAAAHVLRAAREGRRPVLDPGFPGTGAASLAAATGAGSIGAGSIGAGTGGLGGGSAGHDAGGRGPTGGRTGGGEAGAGAPIPDLEGQPVSDRAFWESLGNPRPPPGPMRGTGGILPGSTGLPVWSVPSDSPAGSDRGAEGEPDGDPAGATTGGLHLGHDDLGPVVRPGPEHLPPAPGRTGDGPRAGGPPDDGAGGG